MLLHHGGPCKATYNYVTKPESNVDT